MDTKHCPQCLRQWLGGTICPNCECELAEGPPPQPRGYAPDVESAVCEDIKRRQRQGIAKYGTTVAANPLSQREWLTHAYEEALDLAIYLKRIIDGTEAHTAGDELPLPKPSNL